MSKDVLVIDTGTIGEPLIGLLADHKDSLGLDNVIFFKRTPLSDERGKVESLIRKGAKLVSTSEALTPDMSSQAYITTLCSLSIFKSSNVPSLFLTCM